MKITEAEKLIKGSKNQAEFEVNTAVVASAFLKDEGRPAMKILRRTGLLSKIQGMADKTKDVSIVTKNGSKYLSEEGKLVAPLVMMPLEYYMSTLLNLKGSRFYNVYRCLLDSPDIYATLALTDSRHS